MEKRVTRHSSAHATKASTETTAPSPLEATPIDAANGSKRGRGRGRGARGAHASASSVERGRGRRRKRGASAAEESSALEETDHDHDHSESDHAQVSDQEVKHDSDKKQNHEKEGESEKPQEPEKEEGAKTQETEKGQESDSNQEHSEDDSEEDSSSSGSESESEEEEEEEVSLSKDKDESNAMDVDFKDTPNAATIPATNTASASQSPTENMDEDRPTSSDNLASGAFEEVSRLPFISPTFPPKFDTKEVELMPLDSNDHPPLPASSSSAPSTMAKSKSTTSSSIGATRAVSRSGFFLDEGVYNKLSIGGTERIAELYILKKRRREKGSSPEPGPRLLSDIETGAPSTKPKRRASGSFAALITAATATTSKTASHPSAVLAHAPAAIPTTASEDHAQTTTSAPPVVPVQSSTINLNDLIASVSSYKSEITSIVDKPNTTQQPPVQQPTQQQQQQNTIAAIKPADIRYHHPCISAHQYRSSLTREEHRRYMMYDGVLRRQKTPGAPQLGQEDRALFGLLQERVEAERLRVRQWCDSECRSRVISYFNPLIRDALAPKFRRGRARVKEEYPQYYDFVHSIGLRLPGVPSTTKEPMLSRAQLEEPKAGAAEMTGNKPTAALRRRGLLQRTGKICPVSLAKPILPTDENGVPYEKTIDVVDSYWNQSASPPPATDRRRGPMPFKRPAASVAKDPVAKDFVKEQNVHIALSSSAMVALAKTLPGLTNEWEIPVTVVLEEDSEGN